jgi:solute carrier family 24 (sodium/potassium/calcium exchanger), member 6
VLFYLLGTSADSYFCKSLDLIADGLKMSPEIAGLTILALGNGAPDVSSTILSAVTGSFDMGIGELFGAGLFVTTCVVGAVTFFANDAKLDRHSFVRDVSFYLVAVVGVFFICWDGKIYIYESVSFLVFYMIYVAFAIIVHYCGGKKKSSGASADDESINRSEFQPLLGSSGSFDSSTTETRTSSVHSQVHHTHHTLDSIIDPSSSEDEAEEEDNDPWTFERWRRVWGEKSKFAKFFWIATFLVRLPLTVSIPSIRWNRFVSASTPIFAPVFALLFLGKISNTVLIGSANVPWAVLAALCGIPVAALIFLTSKTNAKPIYYPVVVFFTFTLSIMVITGVAQELVGLLKSIGLIVDIPPIILGATVLAWGNSVGDLVANVVQAKNGNPGMSIAACYGGPLFNLLVSLGVSLTILTAKTIPNPFLVKTDHLFLLTGGFLFFVLWTSLIFISVRCWRLKWPLGVYLIILYIAFMVLTVLIKFGIVWPESD